MSVLILALEITLGISALFCLFIAAVANHADKIEQRWKDRFKDDNYYS